MPRQPSCSGHDTHSRVGRRGARHIEPFIKSIAKAATDGDSVRLAPVHVQPMAADDVASAVGRVSVAPPLNSTIEIAGPEQLRLESSSGEASAHATTLRQLFESEHLPPAS